MFDDQPGAVASMINMLGIYDFNNMNFVKIILDNDSVFIDVGANIGPYTILASENPSVRVISVEPNKLAFAKLSANIGLNVRKNVTALNIGLSKEKSSARMTNYGALPTNMVVKDSHSTSDTIEVEVDRLDNICESLKVTPSVIKIDVEGHEPEVLSGATNCLNSVIACIVENGERKIIIDMMQAHKFDGPYYYNHQLRQLQRTPKRLREDPIFIKRTAGIASAGLRIHE